MMEFLAANFNLPTIIVAVIVFGGVGWITWHSHKHGGGCSGCSGCGEGGCNGSCRRLQRLSLSIEMIRKGRGLELSARALFSKRKS